MSAALVLSLIALWQTWQLDRLTPVGTPTSATVLAREMRLPHDGAALAESVVVLSVVDPAGSTFTVVTPHPPATLTDIWVGATVTVAPTGPPPHVAYWPTARARARRATLIALAFVLGLAAFLGILSRLAKR